MRRSVDPSAARASSTKIAVAATGAALLWCGDRHARQLGILPKIEVVHSEMGHTPGERAREPIVRQLELA